MREQRRRQRGLSGVPWLAAKMNFVSRTEEQMLSGPALVHGAVLRGWLQARRDGAERLEHAALGAHTHGAGVKPQHLCATKHPPCPPASG